MVHEAGLAAVFPCVAPFSRFGSIPISPGSTQLMIPLALVTSNSAWLVKPGPQLPHPTPPSSRSSTHPPVASRRPTPRRSVLRSEAHRNTTPVWSHQRLSRGAPDPNYLPHRRLEGLGSTRRRSGRWAPPVDRVPTCRKHIMPILQVWWFIWTLIDKSPWGLCHLYTLKTLYTSVYIH